MRIDEIVECINDIEDNFPVQEWQIDNIDVWPTVRIKLYFDLFEHATFRKTNSTPPTRRKFKKIINLTGRIAIFYVTLLRLRKQPSVSKCDSLFLDDPSYITYSDKEYQRFCDPVIEDITRDHGKISLTLSTIEHPLISTFSPTRFIYGSLQYHRACGALAAKIRPTRNVILPDLEHYNTYIQALGHGAQKINQRDLIREITMFQSMVCFYKKILTKTQPSAAFVVCYYDSLHMSFIHACREMHIPTIDLQHGVTGEYHIGYGRWKGVPNSGYNVLPDYFACWDKESMLCISKWGSISHQAILFGNRFLEITTRKLYENGDNFSKAFLNIQATLKPEKNILLSVQNKYLLTDILTETLRLSPKSFFWWIRIHPMATKEEQEKIYSDLNEIQGLQYNVTESTSGNLYKIIPKMDAHVTLNSSVAIESAQFGVPSIMCDDIAFWYYRELLDSGMATMAHSAGDVLAAISVAVRGEDKKSNIDPDVLYSKIGLI